MTLTSSLWRLFVWFLTLFSFDWRPKGGDASIGGGEAKVKGGGAVDGGASRSSPLNKNARKKHSAKKQRQRQRKSSLSSLSSSSSRNASSSSSSKANASSSSSWNAFWFALWLIYTQFIYSSIEADKDCWIVLWIAFAVLYPAALSVVVYLMKRIYLVALRYDSKIAPSNRKALREHRRKASRELRKCNGRKAPVNISSMAIAISHIGYNVGVVVIVTNLLLRHQFQLPSFARPIYSSSLSSFAAITFHVYKESIRCHQFLLLEVR